MEESTEHKSLMKRVETWFSIAQLEFEEESYRSAASEMKNALNIANAEVMGLQNAVTFTEEEVQALRAAGDELRSTVVALTDISQDANVERLVNEGLRIATQELAEDLGRYCEAPRDPEVSG
ncbi:hypothetical protein HDU93_007196 [Gonapodya sp. JEL0774]|nr:hypothetical protein HDU93_007196 [Gonapodya sp. JEL0774]